MGSAHRLSALCRWGKSVVQKRAIASAALTFSFGRLAEAQQRLGHCVHARQLKLARADLLLVALAMRLNGGYGRGALSLVPRGCSQ